MRKWNLFAGATLAAAALALGPAACGNSSNTTCSSSSDCSAPTPACDIGCGLCFKTCATAADCSNGDVCTSLCNGSTTLACMPSGTGGSGGQGGGGGSGGSSGCTDNTECETLPGYCSTAGTCVGVNCGAEANNTCNTACGMGPNSGDQQAGAPIIISTTQVDADTSDGNTTLCKQTPACGQGNECHWNVRYFIPTGGSDIGSLNTHTFIHTSNGSFSAPAEAVVRVDAETVTIAACFSATTNNPASALYFTTASNAASNTFCFAGTAP